MLDQQRNSSNNYCIIALYVIIYVMAYFVVDYETLTRIDYFNQKKFCLAHDEDTIWFISAWGQFNIYYRWP